MKKLMIAALIVGANFAGYYSGFGDGLKVGSEFTNVADYELFRHCSKISGDNDEQETCMEGFGGDAYYARAEKLIASPYNAETKIKWYGYELRYWLELHWVFHE